MTAEPDMKSLLLAIVVILPAQLTHAAEPPMLKGHGPPPEDFEREIRAQKARLAELRAEFAPFFEARARDILERGEATIEATNGGRLRARLVRFRNGAVFETDYVSPTGSGRGKTRIEGDQLDDPVPILAGYLIQAALNLGSDARPTQ